MNKKQNFSISHTAFALQRVTHAMMARAGSAIAIPYNASRRFLCIAVASALKKNWDRVNGMSTLMSEPEEVN